MKQDELTELDFEDPVDWVYEVRRRISEKYGHDIGKYMSALREQRAIDESRGIRYGRLPIARRPPIVV